jgi:Cu/Zn superoxide dismutase
MVVSGKSIKGGFMWDPANAYSDEAKTKLKVGYYHQAIYFTDEGTFTETTEFNMGTSEATLYKANGTTEKFNASIYPARSANYATTPEGEYEANVGLHKNSYKALHIHDKGNIGSESIDLGAPNPSNPATNFATGIHIHKAGLSNKTGLTTSGAPISAGCLLIDINKWSSFMNNFSNQAQKNNIVGVKVSRSS